MKVCVVNMQGVQYKTMVPSNARENDHLIESNLSDLRVFPDILDAVVAIRNEEEKNGLTEYWADESHDEETDEVNYVYLFFKNGYDEFSISKSYYFHLVEVEQVEGS